MCYFHLSPLSQKYTHRQIQRELSHWYWRFVYDRLSRLKRRHFERCIKNNQDDHHLTLNDMMILLERSKTAKKNYLYWKKISKKEGLYYKILCKYKKNKPNPEYHDKAFFRKIPDFLKPN